MRYHKIHNLFKREGKKLLFDEYSLPEFEYLKDCSWEWTEKVDGTNVRVEYDSWGNENSVKFWGRNGNELPENLKRELEKLLPIEKFKEYEAPMTIFGEGYGCNIQKGHGYFPNEIDKVGFACFDVNIGGIFIDRFNIEDICSKMGIDVVPYFGEATIPVMVNRMRKSIIKSKISDNKVVEGFVGVPAGVRLFNHLGKRIIVKIRYEDINKMPERGIDGKI